jgi:hypothetical protein
LQKATRDQTEDHPIVSFGAKDTDAEAGLGAVRNGKVCPAGFFGAFEIVGWDDRADEVASIFGGEGGAFGWFHLTRNPEDGRLPDLEMEIGGFSLDYQI